MDTYAFHYALIMKLKLPKCLGWTPVRMQVGVGAWQCIVSGRVAHPRTRQAGGVVGEGGEGLEVWREGRCWRWWLGGGEQGSEESGPERRPGGEHAWSRATARRQGAWRSVATTHTGKRPTDVESRELTSRQRQTRQIGPSLGHAEGTGACVLERA